MFHRPPKGRLLIPKAPPPQRLADLQRQLPGHWEKLADEGASTPYWARLWAGVLGLRDSVLLAGLPPADRSASEKEFDRLYGTPQDASRSFRDAARRVQTLVARHVEELKTGSNWHRVGAGFSVDNTASSELRNQVGSMLERGYSTIKGTQPFLLHFGLDIGCLFARDAAFGRGVARLLSEGRPELAEYLTSVRSGWSQQFIHRRDALVHSGWNLEAIKHETGRDGRPAMIEPTVDGLPVSVYARSALNHVLGFTEDVVVYALSTRLEFPHIIREIPPAERNPDMPERFARDFKRPSVEPWRMCLLRDYGFD